jgi:hypothetical protein
VTYEALLRHTVVVFNPDISSEGADLTRYGDEELSYDAGTSWPGLVQQEGATENIIDRDTRTTSFVLFLPKEAVITALSYVEWSGLRFRVRGEPDHVDDRYGLHHIEASLEVVAG